jgi:hypothetical protein
MRCRRPLPAPHRPARLPPTRSRHCAVTAQQLGGGPAASDPWRACTPRPPCEYRPPRAVLPFSVRHKARRHGLTDGMRRHANWSKERDNSAARQVGTDPPSRRRLQAVRRRAHARQGHGKQDSVSASCLSKRCSHLALLSARRVRASGGAHPARRSSRRWSSMAGTGTRWQVRAWFWHQGCGKFGLWVRGSCCMPARARPTAYDAVRGVRWGWGVWSGWGGMHKRR